MPKALVVLKHTLPVKYGRIGSVVLVVNCMISTWYGRTFGLTFFLRFIKYFVEVRLPRNYFLK